MDISRIKKALETPENPNANRGGGSDNLVKLPKGDHVIRFLPYKHDPGMPFRELHTHYNIANQSFLCPSKMGGDPCPICSFAGEIWNKYKQTQNEDLKEKFKDIMPKLRIYVPVIVRESADPELVSDKPKFWGIAPKTYEEILTEVVAADSEGIDITDPESGLDFTIKMDNFMQRQDRFMVKSAKAARKSSKLASSKKAIEEILNAVPDIHEIFQFRAVAEMDQALAKLSGRGGDSGNSNMSSGTVKDFSSGSEDSKEEDDNVSSEIDKQFEDLDFK